MRHHTDPQVHADRTAWLRTLADPHARKAHERLRAITDDGTEGRCCLGHACEALGASPTGSEEEQQGYEGETTRLPERLAQRLDVTRSGMFTKVQCIWRETDGLHAAPAGSPAATGHDCLVLGSLAVLNDDRHLDATPQEIGRFLETHFTLLHPYDRYDAMV